MRKRNRVVARLIAAATIVGLAGATRAQENPTEAGKLKVKVEYTGQLGTVDKEHKIWVWLFDTPNITPEATPVAVTALSENKGSYQFVSLPKVVYIAAAFDNRGGYDGSTAPPPSGTPLTIFGGATPGMATAVTTGADDAAVTVAFDDAIRMP